jgi:hypothetical protein
VICPSKPWRSRKLEEWSRIKRLETDECPNVTSYAFDME